MLSLIHAFTEGAVELRALPNIRGEGRPAYIFTRDTADVEAFVRQWNRPGYGVYFGVATRDPASVPPGSRETVREVPALWLDNDVTPKDELQAALLASACPPSLIVDSGRGLHAYWLLNEAAEPTDEIVALLRAVAAVFSGDRAVCDLARIMRLPGTTNSKRDPAVECAVVYQSERRHDLTDLRDWLSWQRPLVGEPVDPFLAAADRLGVRPALDVQAALAGMSYPDNIHDVQLRVSASLLAAGKTEDEIVETLLTATRQAAGEVGLRWDWRKEEQGIRELCAGARKKFRVVEGGRRQVNGPDMPADDDLPPSKKFLAGRVARMALEVFGRPVITVQGEMYAYAGGIWEPVEEHELRTYIHGAARAAGDVGNNILNGAYRWIHEDPANVRRGVAWDAAGVIVGLNGALDLATGQIVPHSPEHWATRRVGCAIDPAAACPAWLRFLAEKTPDGCTETLQEWFGAALVRGKRRELSKGLFIIGPSRSGKTQVSEVIRALLGGRTCGVHVKAMSERFGLQPLLNASGWIADDAVGQGTVMDAEAYKVIVTGEAVSVERKNKTSMDVRFDMPVLLTMNAFPTIRDDSDAVYNRTLTLPMPHPTPEDGAREIAAEVIADELAGVLNWAVAGWKRAVARGLFEPPAAMLASGGEFKSQNNPFSDFAKLYLVRSPYQMIMRHDLLRIFNAWHKAEYGGREWTGKAVAKALRGVLDGVIGDDTQKGRVWLGMRFAEAVQPYNQQAFGEAQSTVDDLNKGIPHDLQIKHGIAQPRTRF